MSEPVVTLRGVRKKYGAVVALERLDLDVRRGAVFGLLGPNGAGKSTTFGLVCGWLRADAGEARVLGVPSREIHRLRGRVSALPQDAAFPKNATVRRQLVHFGLLAGLTRARAEDEAHRALAAVGMSEAAERKGGELSHGMLKRVGLAQALVGEPELILLDEPTAGLDPAAARQVKDLVGGLAPRATVVISSHNLAEIQEVCSHGAILDHGRLVQAGSIGELTRRGTEISIELGEGPPPPLARLRESFVAASVEGRVLSLTCQAGEDVAAAIARALRALLDAGTPILGVRRGTSLEDAFLAATGGAPPRAAARQGS